MSYKKMHVYVDEAVSYDIFARKKEDPDILNDENIIARGFENKQMAIGYAMGVFEWSEFSNLYVVKHSSYNSWEEDDAPADDLIIVWECSGIEVEEIEEEDVIEEETNELVDSD